VGSKASMEHVDVDPSATRTSVGQGMDSTTTPMETSWHTLRCERKRKSRGSKAAETTRVSNERVGAKDACENQGETREPKPGDMEFPKERRTPNSKQIRRKKRLNVTKLTMISYAAGNATGHGSCRHNRGCAIWQPRNRKCLSTATRKSSVKV